MLGHERQAEPGADPLPGRAAPGEPFEDPRSLARPRRRARRPRPPSAQSCHRRVRSRSAAARRRGSSRSPTGCRGCVRTGPGRRPHDEGRGDGRRSAVRRSRNDARPDRRTRRGRRSRGGGRWRRRRSATARAGRSPCRRTGAPGSRRRRAPAACARGARSRRASSTSTAADEGGDRRPQLVADVGREAHLALDPRLHGVGHVVERPGEAVEVGVARRLEPGAEPAGGDLPGGVGDPAQRTQQAAAGRPAEERGEHGGHDRRRRSGSSASTAACVRSSPSGNASR